MYNLHWCGGLLHRISHIANKYGLFCYKCEKCNRYTYK
jgi:hypothetical protein